MSRPLKQFLASTNREDVIFGLSCIKRIIELAERLYKKQPDEGLLESIDVFYRIVEKYDVS